MLSQPNRLPPINNEPRDAYCIQLQNGLVQIYGALSVLARKCNDHVKTESVLSQNRMNSKRCSSFFFSPSRAIRFALFPKHVQFNVVAQKCNASEWREGKKKISRPFAYRTKIVRLFMKDAARRVKRTRTEWLQANRRGKKKRSKTERTNSELEARTQNSI